MMDVIQNLIGTLPAMHDDKVCFYLLNKVVLEDAFDELM
jgi:hypothetical protein